MSLSVAIWVMEQEAKAIRWIRGQPQSSGKDWGEMSPGEQVFISTAGTGWVMGHLAIAAQPYTRMFGYVAKQDLFLRELALYSSRSHGGMGVPLGFRFGIRGFAPKFMTATVRRKLFAKAVLRFIPYAGWALLVLDLWHVGKWIGYQTS